MIGCLNNDDVLMSVLKTQNLGVLATTGETYPYTTLVGFAATEDMKNVIFATMKQTRKYSNLKRSSKASILINSSTNSAGDFKDATSITVLGDAVDSSTKERPGFESLLLAKFPYLEDFFKDPSCVIVKLVVRKMIIVTRFQDVREIDF